MRKLHVILLSLTLSFSGCVTSQNSQPTHHGAAKGNASVAPADSKRLHHEALDGVDSYLSEESNLSAWDLPSRDLKNARIETPPKGPVVTLSGKSLAASGKGTRWIVTFSKDGTKILDVKTVAVGKTHFKS